MQIPLTLGKLNYGAKICTQVSTALGYSAAAAVTIDRCRMRGEKQNKKKSGGGEERKDTRKEGEGLVYNNCILSLFPQ